MKVLPEIWIFSALVSLTLVGGIFGQSCSLKLQGEDAISGGRNVNDSTASGGAYLGGITTQAPVIFPSMDFGNPGQQLFEMRVSLDVTWGYTAWYYLSLDGKDNQVGVVTIGTTGGDTMWVKVVTFFEYYPAGNHVLYVICSTDFIGGNCPNIDYIAFHESVM